MENTENENEFLWECFSCKVQVIKGKEDLEWKGGDTVHYQGSSIGHSYGDLYSFEDPTEESEHSINFEDHCPGCARLCMHGDCEESIFNRSIDFSDCYDPGYPMPIEDGGYCGKVVCMGCYENHYSHCGACGHDFEMAEEDDPKLPQVLLDKAWECECFCSYCTVDKALECEECKEQVDRWDGNYILVTVDGNPTVYCPEDSSQECGLEIPPEILQARDRWKLEQAGQAPLPGFPQAVETTIETLTR